MTEKLVLSAVETVTYTKEGESKELYKAIFPGGRKAVFFSETLKKQLEERKGKELEFEFEPPRRENGDPGIKRVLEGGEQLFPKKGGGGSRPLMSDEQAKWIAAGFHDIADAIRSLVGAVGDRAVTGAAVTKRGEPVRLPDPGEGGGPPTAPSSDRDGLLHELTELSHRAFPDSERLYEKWLSGALKDRGAAATDDLDPDALKSLVEDLGKIADARASRGAA